MDLKRLLGVTLLSTLGALNFAAADDDVELSRPSLHGLGAVMVSVRIAVTETTKGIIDESSVQTDAELRLRKAGIRVLPRSDDAKANANLLERGAFIDVALTLVGNQRFYAAHWEISVEQPTRLVRDSATIVPLAVTWSSGGTAILNDADFAADPRILRDDLADSVDKFINAYLSVNPRR